MSIRPWHEKKFDHRPSLHDKLTYASIRRAKPEVYRRGKTISTILAIFER